jgi:hypothetical protein
LTTYNEARTKCLTVLETREKGLSFDVKISISLFMKFLSIYPSKKSYGPNTPLTKCIFNMWGLWSVAFDIVFRPLVMKLKPKALHGWKALTFRIPEHVLNSL